MGKNWVFLLLLALVLAGPAALGNESDYVDEDGEHVVTPDAKTAFTLENPGPWKQYAQFHEPVVKYRKLVQGLESTWVLKITVPHPMGKTNAGAKFPIKGIYLVEKDRQLIGYQPFFPEDKEAVYETKINGIINYIEVYVECRQHGMWMMKVHLT